MPNTGKKWDIWIGLFIPNIAHVSGFWVNTRNTHGVSPWVDIRRWFIVSTGDIFSPVKFTAMAYHSTRFNKLNPIFPEQWAPTDSTQFYSSVSLFLRLFYVILVLLSAWGGDAGPPNSRSHTVELQACSSSQVSRRIDLADNWELHDRAWHCTKGSWNPISAQSPAQECQARSPALCWHCTSASRLSHFRNQSSYRPPNLQPVRRNSNQLTPLHLTTLGQMLSFAFIFSFQLLCRLESNCAAPTCFKKVISPGLSLFAARKINPKQRAWYSQKTASIRTCHLLPEQSALCLALEHNTRAA